MLKNKFTYVVKELFIVSCFLFIASCGGSGSSDSNNDVSASASYDSFTTTANSIAGNIVCADSDGLQSCESAKTTNLDSDTPAYIAFSSVTGGSVNYTSLAGNTKFRVWTRVYSLNKDSNNHEYHTEFKVYTTGISTPIINDISTITINDDGGLTNRNVLTVKGTNILSNSVFSLTDNLSGRLSINSTTGIILFRGNEAGDDMFTITVKVVNPDGGEDTEGFTLIVIDSF